MRHNDKYYKYIDTIAILTGILLLVAVLLFA